MTRLELDLFHSVLSVLNDFSPLSFSRSRFLTLVLPLLCNHTEPGVRVNDGPCASAVVRSVVRSTRQCGNDLKGVGEREERRELSRGHEERDREKEGSSGRRRLVEEKHREEIKGLWRASTEWVTGRAFGGKGGVYGEAVEG